MTMPLAPSRTFQWDPAAYAVSSSSQQAWARELIAKLRLTGRERILDVGCGDGKVTAELARAVPHGSVTGIDASPDMIAFASKTFPPNAISNLSFQRMDARQIQFGRPFDLIFSNAALHWVDDHQAFLRGASGCLQANGALVVSCGGKGNAHGVFLALRAELRRSHWKLFFRGMTKPYFFYSPVEYRTWLQRYGLTVRNLGLAEKDMVCDGPEGLAAWLRTTWMPYTQRVPEVLREEFIQAVTTRYVAKHPMDQSGRVHVRMVRLEIDAVKASA